MVAAPSVFCLKTEAAARFSSSPDSSRASPSRSSSVTAFEPAEGWNTFQTSVGADRGAPQAAWAANVPFESEELDSGFPHNTLRCLPENGIVIVAVGPWLYKGGERVPRHELPLRFSDGFFVSNHYEDQPAPHVSMTTIRTWVGDAHIVNVIVWIGNNNPNPGLVQLVDEQLARLRIASPAASQDFFASNG